MSKQILPADFLRAEEGDPWWIPRVFIVEDDPSCELVLRKVVLSIRQDARVSSVTSAEAALATLKRRAASGQPSFDLIIADIFLEGSATGLELWQICQTDFSEARILLTSVMSQNHLNAVIGDYLICPPFLPKPFSVLKARETVKELLEQGRQAILADAA